MMLIRSNEEVVPGRQQGHVLLGQAQFRQQAAQDIIVADAETADTDDLAFELRYRIERARDQTVSRRPDGRRQ